MPAAETTASMLIAASSATGTYLLQQAGQVPAPVSWAWLMPVISAGISLITTLAVLKVKTDHLQKTADEFRREMREDLRDIYSLMRDTSERVAHLEGKQ